MICELYLSKAVIYKTKQNSGLAFLKSACSLTQIPTPKEFP